MQETSEFNVTEDADRRTCYKNTHSSRTYKHINTPIPTYISECLFLRVTTCELRTFFKQRENACRAVLLSDRCFWWSAPKMQSTPQTQSLLDNTINAASGRRYASVWGLTAWCFGAHAHLVLPCSVKSTAPKANKVRNCAAFMQCRRQ